MEESCTEIEVIDKINNQLMYKKYKGAVGKLKFNYKNALKKADRTNALKVEEIKTGYEEYFGELFFRHRPERYGAEFNTKGPVILKGEVR